jgi:hypothetical protein
MMGWARLLNAALLLILALVSAVWAAPLKSTEITEAVKAIQTDTPSSSQKRAVERVLAAMLEEHAKKLKLADRPVKPPLAEQLNQVSRLALMTVAAMTADNPQALRQFTLEDLMSVAGVVMGKIKELKVTDSQLKDRNYLVDSFIPKVIEALAR